MGLGLGILIILAGELIVGHVLLFLLLHRVARLHPSTAIRLAHVAGLALGYAVAAFVVQPTAEALDFWAGAPAAPGAAVAALTGLWALLILFLPPGLAGPRAD